MPTGTGLNSPLVVTLGKNAPDSIPPDLRGYFDDIHNAIFQLQQAFVTYCGIAQQDHNFWQSFKAADTVIPQNLNRCYIQFSEAIVAGGMINVVDVAGTKQARNANAANNTKMAHGYSTEGVAAGDFGEVILGHGLCTSVGGLTVGARYYLSTVNGLITAIAPVAAGNIEQLVGIAMSATELFVTMHYYVQH